MDPAAGHRHRTPSHNTYHHPEKMLRDDDKDDDGRLV
jgi:hypothetical protein